MDFMSLLIILKSWVVNYWNDSKGKIIELERILHSRVKADQKCLNSRKTELSASFRSEFLKKKNALFEKNHDWK